jgi:menaquinone-dependent protoporphyrinogen oxidase
MSPNLISPNLISPNLISRKPIPRRSFLKMGCLTATVAGLTVCGVTVVAPDPPPVQLQSFTFGEETVNNRVLVAYASAMGSTIGVAAEIGKSLAAHNFSVDVKPIQGKPQLDSYQAVVIGSAVQNGNWLPEAVEFVKINQQMLGRVPVALFCVHIQNLGNDETSRQNRLAYLNEVRRLISPVADSRKVNIEGYFAGRFDRRGAALLLPGWLARFVPTLDFRNWNAIRAWTESISPLLLQPA